MSCDQWNRCYGDHCFQVARQDVSTPEAEEYLWANIELQLSFLCARNDKVLVRLHVLGDFYSVEYVQFWEEQLWLHEGLYLYGYTHRPEGDPIHTAIKDLNTESRTRILLSDQAETPWEAGHFLVVDEWEDTPPRTARCPAELTGRDLKCVDCTLCFPGFTLDISGKAH